MNNKNILFILPQLDSGGSERVVLSILEKLYLQGFNLFVVSFKSGDLIKIMEKFCKKIFIIKKRSGIDFCAMSRIFKIIKRNNIDVVNAHHYMPCLYSFLSCLLIKKLKIVYTEHSVREVTNIYNSKHRKIFNLMMYRIDTGIGVSKEITDKFKELYPSHNKKFHEISNGVDIEKFHKKINSKNVRERFGLASDDFVIGMIANFRRVKNHACLVRAFAHLIQNYPKARLLFVGSGFADDIENSEAEVRDLVGSLGLQGKVVFSGYQENIPEILKAIDVFCLPSFSEGLPVSVLEAMASEVPVVCSDVLGNRELIEHGKTGMLFRSNDEIALADILSNMVDEDKTSKTMTDNALGYIKENNNIAKSVERLLTCIS